MLQIKGAEDLPWRSVVTITDDNGKRYHGISYLNGLVAFTTPADTVSQKRRLNTPQQRLTAAHMMLAFTNTEAALGLGITPRYARESYNAVLRRTGVIYHTALMSALLRTQPPELAIVHPVDPDITSNLKDHRGILPLLNKDWPPQRLARAAAISRRTLSSDVNCLLGQLPIVHEEVTSRHKKVLLGTVAIMSGFPPYDELPVGDLSGASGPLTVEPFAVIEGVHAPLESPRLA